MAGVFLSYRREDSRWAALLLAENLRRRLGADQVFHDVDGIRAGAQWRALIASALDTCPVLVALIGRAWGAVPDAAGRRRLHEPDDPVAFEIARALRAGTSIVPVLVDGAEMPDRDLLPDPLQQLSEYQAAVPLAYPSWRENVDRIVDAVAAALPPPSPATVDDAEAIDSTPTGPTFDLADDPRPTPERPPPPPPAPPSTDVEDLSELGVLMWRSSAAPLLLEVGAALDRGPAADLVEVAERYAGRLRVARCPCADPASRLHVVSELEVTAFPTLVLFRNRFEVTRAGPDARAALLRDLPVLLD